MKVFWEDTEGKDEDAKMLVSKGSFDFKLAPGSYYFTTWGYGAATENVDPVAWSNTVEVATGPERVIANVYLGPVPSTNQERQGTFTWNYTLRRRMM
jgi:hypothetical protein